MRTLTTILFVLLVILCALADPAQPDTIATQELSEVVVKAPKVIRKADMDIYIPSKATLEISKNGMQLLANLMIPSLSVSDALGTIKAAGQPVQVRINGREASADQVSALQPETVRRVEWMDNPGLRYGGASYVVNIIVSNPTLGGSVMANAMPALNQAWGNYMADIKLNNGRSQFEVWGKFKLTDKIKTHREYRETFAFPDGGSLTRNETSRGGQMDNSMGNFTASYSYIKPDTTVFMLDLSYFEKFTDKFRYNGLMSLSNGSDDLLLSDTHGEKGFKPYMSMYLEQHFARKQTLVVDFSSSFLWGKSYSDYVEQLPDATDRLTDIHTMIRDRNQAYAIEADYIKKWDNSRLTAGASYTANRNRSVYENLGGRVFHQRQDKVYIFGEYLQRIKKVTLTAGLGAQYTNILFKETDQGSSSWNLRPQATATYGINQNHQLRLSFETWQSTPTLAETNIAPQQLDGFQWRIGNPNLKTSNSYMLTLRYYCSIPRASGTFGVRAFTSPDAITPLLYWQDNKLITTYENSNGLRNLSFFIAPQIDVIPEWLMLSGYLQYRMERMEGSGYKLHNYNWSGNSNLRLTHWGFSLSAQYVRAQHDLWGEKISWGENISVVDLSYNLKDWQFGAGMIMPFGRYDQGSKMISKWNTNEQHMRLDMRMPYISISYNLRWGRQNRGARKLVNADANTDQSTAGGR